MSVRLTVKQRSEAGESGAEHVLDDAEITLGRDKSCHVILSEQAVSRTHAKISRDGALFFVEDLGSAYGTQVNGKKLPKGEKRLLRNGDVIAIAQFDVVFERMAELKPSNEKTSFVARQAVKDVMKGLGGEEPFFRIMNGPKEGTRIEIGGAQELVIGRDGSADLIFEDDLMSRRHCKIRRDWSGTHVEDLASRNGIKVNKKRITQKTLRDRDELQVGGTRLLYLDASEVRDAAPEEPELVENTEPPRDEPEPEPVPAAASSSSPAASESSGMAPAASESSSAASAAQSVESEPAASIEKSVPEARAEIEEEEEDEPAPGPGKGRRLPKATGEQKATLAAIAAMALFGLIAIIVVIAVLVGA